MKVIEKKIDRVVIELTSEEINRLGFDKIWDDIRQVYPVQKFEIENIEENHNGKIYLINLKDLDFVNALMKLKKKNIKKDDLD